MAQTAGTHNIGKTAPKQAQISTFKSPGAAHHPVPAAARTQDSDVQTLLCVCKAGSNPPPSTRSIARLADAGAQPLARQKLAPRPLHHSPDPTAHNELPQLLPTWTSRLSGRGGKAPAARSAVTPLLAQGMHNDHEHSGAERLRGRSQHPHAHTPHTLRARRTPPPGSQPLSATSHQPRAPPNPSLWRPARVVAPRRHSALSHFAPSTLRHRAFGREVAERRRFQGDSPLPPRQRR